MAGEDEHKRDRKPDRKPDRGRDLGRHDGNDFPTLHEDERDASFDTYRVAAPEGPPPEGQRSKDDLEAQTLGDHPRHDGRDTLREDDRDAAYDRMPVENPDAPPPGRD